MAESPLQSSAFPILSAAQSTCPLFLFPNPYSLLLVRPVVTLFAMLRQVKSNPFVFIAHPQPDNLIDHEEYHQCPHNRQRPGNRNAYKLVQHLMPVPFQKPGRLPCAEDRINDAVGKNTGQDRSHCSARPVYPKG